MTGVGDDVPVGKELHCDSTAHVAARAHNIFPIFITGQIYSYTRNVSEGTASSSQLMRYCPIAALASLLYQTTDFTGLEVILKVP